MKEMFLRMLYSEGELMLMEEIQGVTREELISNLWKEYGHIFE